MPTLKSIVLEFLCDAIVCIIFYSLGIAICYVIGNEFSYTVGFIMGLTSAVLFITVIVVSKLMKG